MKKETAGFNPAFKTGKAAYLQTNYNYNTEIRTCKDILRITWRYYHELGLTPIPLRPNLKVPVSLMVNEKQWKWGSWNDRRPPWEEVETVFKQAIAKFDEEINIGLICGKLHGKLCVLDVDDPAKFEVAIKTTGLNLPKTPIVKTRKGYHIYFRYPEGYEITRIERLNDWGAEIRGDKHYVVAPPSIVDGHKYHFITINGETRDLRLPLAEVPAEILEAFGAKTTAQPQPQQTTPSTNSRTLSQQTITAVKALLLPYWSEGVRHDLSLYLAGWLAKEGYPYDDVMNLITEIARDAGDDEIRDRWRAIRDTYEKAQNGNEIKGWQGLCVILDNDTLQSLRGLLSCSTQIVAISEIKRPEKPHNGFGER